MKILATIYDCGVILTGSTKGDYFEVGAIDGDVNNIRVLKDIGRWQINMHNKQAKVMASLYVDLIQKGD